MQSGATTRLAHRGHRYLVPRHACHDAQRQRRSHQPQGQADLQQHKRRRRGAHQHTRLPRHRGVRRQLQPTKTLQKTHVVVAQLSQRERVVGIQLCDAALNGGDVIQLDQERNIAPLCRVSDAQPAAPCR